MGSNSNATYPRNRRERLLSKQVCCCCSAAHRALELAGAVIVGQHVFVDPVNGNDATGLRERLDRPFLTLAAGFAASEDGDTVALQPGSYVISASVDMPNYATLFVEGWGGPQNVQIEITTANPIFRMTNPAEGGQVLWGFSNIFFTSTVSGSQAIVFGDAATDRFIFSALIFEYCAFFTQSDGPGDVLLTRIGQAFFFQCFMNQLVANGCSSIEASDCLIQQMQLSFADATLSNFFPAMGRFGFTFNNCWGFLAFLSGAPIAFFDDSCRFGLLGGNFDPSALGGGINPSLRYGGIIGGSDNHFATGQVTNSITVNLQFGSTAWFTGTSGILNGFDFTGMRNFGRTNVNFANGAPNPPDSDRFLFGGDACQLLGGYQVIAPTPGVGVRYLSRFRNAYFGSTASGPLPAIDTFEADVDARSCHFDGTLLASGVGTGPGIDRDMALVEKTETIVAAGSLPILPIFPSYVGVVVPGALTPVFTPNLPSAYVTGQADFDTVDYIASFLGGETMDVLVFRPSP